jgi:hypothetical protein
MMGVRREASMHRVRFSLAGLMGFVVVAGLGFAAMKHPTDLLAESAFTLTSLVLLTGILGSLFRRGPVRAACAGFTLFAGSYFVFGCVVATSERSMPEFSREWQQRLVTFRLLDLLDAYVHPDDAVPQRPSGMSPQEHREAMRKQMEAILESRRFVRIGHTTLALLAGILGAVLGRVIAEGDDRVRPPG